MVAVSGEYYLRHMDVERMGSGQANHIMPEKLIFQDLPPALSLTLPRKGGGNQIDAY